MIRENDTSQAKIVGLKSILELEGVNDVKN